MHKPLLTEKVSPVSDGADGYNIPLFEGFFKA